MKYILILLVLGTTLINAESTIVNGELVLDTRSDCKKQMDDASETFAGHDGSYYSVKQRGETALDFLPEYCRGHRRELEQIGGLIKSYMDYVDVYQYKK